MVFISVLGTAVTGGTSSVCERATTKFNAGQISQLVTKYNELRSSLKSSDAWKVEWDDELAERAQAFTNKCIFGHDLMSRCNGSVLGQNAAAVSSFTDGLSPGLNDWWGEFANYDHSADECAATKVCGHYRQVKTGL
ncbi:peptidase inhibitor 16-like [Tubulanus polymorphus]|uniref:peptidase inhibitor 16-like n=1 Tax=Tubulanus polymorphus TaxID=672921 RepID=UPI003DA347E7